MCKSCYHCGEDVPANTDFKVEILGEIRDMCCPGCETVAQTIVDSGLVSYYQYRTAPAEKADLVPEQLQALIHYDNEDVQSEFVRNHENTSEVTLSLEGVSCAACAWLIENKYRVLKAWFPFVLTPQPTALYSLGIKLKFDLVNCYRSFINSVTKPPLLRQTNKKPPTTIQ